MKKIDILQKHDGFFLLLVLSMILLVLPAQAVIYLDEDFEGPVPFADRAFPVQDSTVTQPVAPLLRGINLRAWDSFHTEPPVTLGFNEGTVTADRAYQGAHSYRLRNGERLAVARGQFPSHLNNWFRLWQFTINTDSLSVSLPQGTEIGHFQVDFSKHGLVGYAPDFSLVIRLVVTAPGQVDVECVNNGAKLGTLSGTADDWLQITILSQGRITDNYLLDSTEGWAAYDPLTAVHKGPQAANGHFPPQIPTGIHVFANHGSLPTVSSTLTRGDYLGADWGNETGNYGDELANTCEIGWEFAAQSNGTIYIDDFYWDGGCHQAFDRAFEHEQAARLHPFAQDVVFPGARLVGDSSFFGEAVSQVPDTNGDGVADMLVGASRESPNAILSTGRAYLIDGVTKQILHAFMSPDPVSNGRFGCAVCGIGDVNGDGRGDVLIGADGETAGGFPGAGMAYLFSGASGALLRSFQSPYPQWSGGYGCALSAVPDITGDGVVDIVIGAYRESQSTFSNAGRAYVYDGATRDHLRQLVSPAEERNGFFGISVQGLVDSDGDGLGEIAVGADGEALFVVKGGRVWIFPSRAGNSDATPTPTPEPVSDTHPPLIVSGPFASDVSNQGALISWHTDEPTSSILRFGLSSPPAAERSGSGQATRHTVYLDQLNPDTEYFIQVSVFDASGNGPTVSSILSFRTSSAPDTAAPTDSSGSNAPWHERGERDCRVAYQRARQHPGILRS